GTIVQAADACMAAGAKGVIVVSTHAVFSGPAVERLSNSVAEEVIVTNTLPLSEDKVFDKLTVLSIAPLIARAVHEVFEDGSVTSLFEVCAASSGGAGRNPHTRGPADDRLGAPSCPSAVRSTLETTPKRRDPRRCRHTITTGTGSTWRAGSCPSACGSPWPPAPDTCPRCA